MKWWKRFILSVLSLIWGFVSLDYLYLAFGMLTGSRANASGFHTSKGLFLRLLGMVLLLVWFLIMAVYTLFLKAISPQIDLIEKDKQTGKLRMRRKWFEVILQYAFVASGLILRWGYLCLIYFPRR